MKVATGVIMVLVLCGLCMAEYSDKQQAALNDVATKCKKKLDISEDSDIPKAVQYGDFAENGDLKKKYVCCTMRMMNFIDEQGTIQKEVLVDFLTDKFDRKLSTEVVEKCATVEGESVGEKANAFFKCFFLSKSFDI